MKKKYTYIECSENPSLHCQSRGPRHSSLEYHSALQGCTKDPSKANPVVASRWRCPAKHPYAPTGNASKVHVLYNCKNAFIFFFNMNLPYLKKIKKLKNILQLLWLLVSEFSIVNRKHQLPIIQMLCVFMPTMKPKSGLAHFFSVR